MADDFGGRLRMLLAERGLGLRAAARSLGCDAAHLSRVADGRQRPSLRLALALDELLGAGGRLVSSTGPRRFPPPAGDSSGAGSGAEAEAEAGSEAASVRAGFLRLLDHADRHGGDTVATAAVQIWRDARRRPGAGAIPGKEQRPCPAAVAEAAESAGWLLFDAGR
ncbi:helix-turn-helix domain-containing protein [Streptomyces carminius]|nr:helix-turn-helix transcriptional regulator [Streptomyces carminius]